MPTRDTLMVARHAPMVHAASMSHTELIGTADAASILHCSHRTVHRLVEDGTLAPAHVAAGGRAGIFLFNRSDVETVAAEREQAAS